VFAPQKSMSPIASSSSTPALLLEGLDNPLASLAATGSSAGAVVAAAPTSSSLSVVLVHPVVLLHILDHHTRRSIQPAPQQRVIGTLLGRRCLDDDRALEITNAFAVPHAERGDEEVAIGKDYNKTMLALHLKAMANNTSGRRHDSNNTVQAAGIKETVVGWYATTSDDPAAPLVGATSSLIHEFYALETADAAAQAAAWATGAAAAATDATALLAGSSSVTATAAAAEPIHLVVDTRLLHNQLHISAYKSTPLFLNNQAAGNVFHELPVTVTCSEPELICLQEMIFKDTTNSSMKDAETTEVLQQSMERLHALLTDTLTFVDQIVDNPQNTEHLAELGKQITDTLAVVPTVRAQVFDQLFHDALQDLLMVSYLSQVTKTQLTIAEKLNATLGI
jgi:translation initiation factor 3 subunit F